MADSAATKFKLQWNDHGNELSRLSRDVFGRDDLTDVTLTCRGGSPFHAHKMILAAASTYFRNFFMEVQGKINQHQVIFMKDIEPTEMEHLLQFIYLGEVDVPGQELERLIAISKELSIIGLDTIKQEEDAPLQRRTPKPAKRKSTTTIENAEPLATKQARVKSDPMYDDELVDQDIFDGYLDNGEDDHVTEGDVQDKLGHESTGSDNQDGDKHTPPHPQDEGFHAKEEERMRASQKDHLTTRRKCSFQQHWLHGDEKDDNGDKFSQYIVPDKNDKNRAICGVCYKSLNVANAGKNALIQHSRRAIHKERMKLMKRSKVQTN